MEEKQIETISGTVETIIFHNEENGFTVFEIDHEGEPLTVVGELTEIGLGEELSIRGQFIAHPTYGSQFKAELCERKLPSSAAAILKYLSSGAIKGIGPVLARKLVDAFGERTLEIMEKEPQKMAALPGVGAAKAAKIRDEFSRVFGVRTAMLYLSELGIDPMTSIRVFRQWGPHTVEAVKQNPFVLCEEGIGVSFEIADGIARQGGAALDDPQRIQAGILHVLRHNLLNGHTCLPGHKLLRAVQALLQVDIEAIEPMTAKLVEESEIVSEETGGETYLYLSNLYRAETYVAGRVSMMLSFSVPEQLREKKDFTQIIDLLEQETGMHYAALQRKAIESALTEPVFILTGGPGTGKTTTLNAIIELLTQQGNKVALAAPTGRAAKRLSEVTGCEAKTIHRLLEVDFRDRESGLNQFKRNEKNPLPFDVVIVDEVSMIDILLCESLVRALRMSAKLILVGDSDQLPSVGPGNVLKNMIDSDVVATVRLEEVFRQAAESLIVTNAHAIVRGEPPELRVRDRDFFFMSSKSYEYTAKTVVDLCKTRLPNRYGFNSLWDIQVIAPSRIGEVGTVELNRLLQEELNPMAPHKREFKRGSQLFREGDKVMQVRNNYDLTWQRENGDAGAGVYNGDIGVIERIDRGSRLFTVRYDDRLAEYTFDLAGELDLAYATTVHKSQGSEFEAVIIPLMNTHKKLYHRNLFYTAVTRAKRLLIILGRAQTVYDMVGNIRKIKRYSNLDSFLSEAVNQK